MKPPTDTHSRKPYSGLYRSLVIAIDVGTTFSGVSYAILEPGEIPKIHGVTRFPGQEHVAGNSKIPSIIYYDKHGNVMAAGAEADSNSTLAVAEEEGWIKAELFKLRLRPRAMQLNMNGMRLSPLPKRKTPVHVFGDYLGYLYRCTRSFITDTHASGQSLWSAVEEHVQFVLSHPNGWEGPQQTRMRNAAVYGGLVPDSDEGRARIRFVTEGEASLHACVLNGLASEVLSSTSKNGFLIADAGGGTLDISAYAIKGTQPLAMEEIAPPDCIFAGSVFVSRRARDFFAEKLKKSKYGSADAIDHIAKRFDETTKRLFRDRNELQFVPFGSPLDKDSTVGVRNGQLKLTGNEVANLFEPSVDAAVTAIKKQIEASNGSIKSVFLVGGYAASPWLFSQMQERLAPFHVSVSRPDTQTSKAVADGAIGFYCDHHVSARMSKFMYGVEFLRELDPNDPEHVARKERLCELPSGPKLLPDAFDCILARGVKVKESTVFTRKYCTELTNLSLLSVFEVEIWCYRGGNVVPKWIDRHDEHFSTLCVVQADLSMLSGSAEPKVGRNGKKYWTIVFSVEINFGLTEFVAKLKWVENGKPKYGPAVIVYNERGHRVEDDDIDVYPEDDQIPSSSSSKPPPGSSSSRSRTPVDYPASSGSRRGSGAGLPSAPESAKGYSPSVTSKFSTRGGSDGDRAGTGSDSDRRREREREKEKERERSIRGEKERTKDKDRSLAYDGRNSIYAPSVSRGHSGGVESTGTSMYAPQSRAGSVKETTSHSRAPSVYAKDSPTPTSAVPGAWDYNKPADEHRQSHPEPSQNLAPVIPPQSNNIDATHDRPRSGFFSTGAGTPLDEHPHSPYVDPPRSPFVPPEYLQGPPTPVHEQRPKSPFIMERPKSAFGGAQNPASAIFGDASPMFGDGGPAANAGGHGGGAGLFEGGPVEVFGSPHPQHQRDTGMFGDEGPVADHSTPVDSWGFNSAPTAPPTESLKSTKSSKKKGVSASASPLGKTSPSNAFLTPENIPPPASTSPVVAPVSPSLGWGATSKAASPYDKKDKPLSPLNPAAQMGSKNASPLAEPKAEEAFDSWGAPVTEQKTDDWGSGGGGGTTWGSGGGGSWGAPSKSPAKKADDGGFGDSATTTNKGLDSWGAPAERVPSRAPSPIPPVSAVSPAMEEPPFSAVEEPATTLGGKKKKKGAKGAAAAPVTSSLFGFDNGEEERKKKEDEEKKKKEEEAERARQEAERHQREEEERKAEQDRLKKEEDDRRQKEEDERIRKEEEEWLKKEEEEKKRKEEEERNAAPIFGKPKKKKGGLAATTTSRSVFDSWGGDDEQQKKEEEERKKKEADEQKKKDEEQKRKEDEAAAADRQREEERKAEQEKSASIFGSGNDTAGGLFSGGLLSSSSLDPPNKPWVSSDSGGGDDTGWGGWAASTPSAKKKGAAKPSPAATATAKPSAFGWGGSFGSAMEEEKPQETPQDTHQSTSLFGASTWGGFGGTNTTSKLDFSFGDPTPNLADELGAHKEETPATETKPIEETGTPGAEGGTGAATPAEGDAENEGDGFTGAAGGKKKKKKKGNGGGADETPKEEEPPKEDPPPEPEPEVIETPVAEVPVVETPVESAAPAAGGGAAKKKKKKK